MSDENFGAKRGSSRNGELEGHSPSNEKDLRAHVRAIREGHGANCSSIGSVIDTLFVAQVAAGALLAVIAASLASQTDTGAKKEPESQPESETETEK